ncbi:hypothetical protein SAMN04487819_11427 [Actinopolyspora alba]|uniref:Uncharacterized protein n=1 Tax=Actinopolyspora alba TaxID=673379 RepID=A0A1I2AP86_9ACTN|nr:hypothetical protein SAMN04487819_11427 [Actinopolyspora alba]
MHTSEITRHEWRAERLFTCWDGCIRTGASCRSSGAITDAFPSCCRQGLFLFRHVESHVANVITRSENLNQGRYGRSASVSPSRRGTPESLNSSRPSVSSASVVGVVCTPNGADHSGRLVRSIST